MSEAEEIRRLVKKYGLQYDAADFSGVTVTSESCWRLRCDFEPNGVVVHSIKEADQVLQKWREQQQAQLGEKAVKQIEASVERAIKQARENTAS